jgi:3-isopropylmalate dehydrogenase
MATYRIAVMPGDGIGAEVTAEALRVLAVVAKEGGLGLEFEEGLIGGAAIDQQGTPLPDATLRMCREAGAILFGAVGGPKCRRGCIRRSSTAHPSSARWSRGRTSW